ncbi:hypothetical protein FOA52_007782 [Chlamydomonas sp. UWO 241]|nr:hypothetical protein FOA52_007782 [Chlamydomonas sp. UWO 241]
MGKNLRAQAAAREETGALLSVRLEQAQARNVELEAEVRELNAAVRSLRHEFVRKAEALESELRLVRETSEMALSDYERRREGELQQVREQLWAAKQEAKAAGERADAMRKQLDERRADVAGFKERLAAAGDRERDLQRQLVAAELRMEQAVGDREAAAESSENSLMWRLTEQRDAANAALSDAQSRLLDKESQIGQLRDRLGHGAHAPSAPSASAAAAGAAAARQAQQLAQQQQQQQQQQLQLAWLTAGGGGVGDPAESPSNSAAGFMATLPSPSAFLLPEQAAPSLRGPGGFGGTYGTYGGGGAGTAGPGSSGGSALPSPAWLPGGGGGGFSQLLSPSGGGDASRYGLGGGLRHGHGHATAAAAAAARAEAYLRHSAEGIEQLLRPLTSQLAAAASPRGAGSGGFGDRGGGGAEREALAALSEAERQNTALRATLAVMRAEMEALQAAAAAAAAADAAAPGDVGVLRAELQESDRDLAQALEHVEVLQAHQTSLAAGAGDAPTSTGGGALPELPFLRGRVSTLSVENRALRRTAVGLRLSAAAAAAAAGNSSGSHAPPHGLPSEGAGGGAGAGAAGAPGSSGAAAAAGGQATHAEEDASASELADALSRAEQLAHENESLMELSNALRAERDRLAGALEAVYTFAPTGPSVDSSSPAHWGGGAGGVGAGVRMGGAPSGSPAATHGASPHLYQGPGHPAMLHTVPQPWPAGAHTPSGTLQPPGSATGHERHAAAGATWAPSIGGVAPHAAAPGSSPGAGLPAAAAAEGALGADGAWVAPGVQVVQHAGAPGGAPYTVLAAMPTPAEVPPFVPSQQWQGAAGGGAAPAGAAQQGGGGAVSPGVVATHATAGFFSASPSQSGGSGVGGIRAEGGGGGGGAGQGGASGAGDERHYARAAAALEMFAGPSAGAAAEVVLARAAAERHQQQQQQQRAGGGSRPAQLDGVVGVGIGSVGGSDGDIDADGQEGASASSPHAARQPPSAVPGSASSRETSSQRARLRALSQRTVKPKVRNYNVRDDDGGAFSGEG